MDARIAQLGKASLWERLFLSQVPGDGDDENIKLWPFKEIAGAAEKPMILVHFLRKKRIPTLKRSRH